MIKRDIRTAVRFSKTEHFIVQTKAGKIVLKVSAYIREVTINTEVKPRLNEEVKQKVDHICKFKGVGVLTVAVILAETKASSFLKTAASWSAMQAMMWWKTNPVITRERQRSPRRATATSEERCTCLLFV